MTPNDDAMLAALALVRAVQAGDREGIKAILPADGDHAETRAIALECANLAADAIGDSPVARRILDMLTRIVTRLSASSEGEDRS